MQKGREWILCSALMYNDTIISGRRHSDCYATLKRFGVHDIYMPDRDSQGFLTSWGRFVNRKEAWVIAKREDQIKWGMQVSDNGDESQLISEMLYDDYEDFAIEQSEKLNSNYVYMLKQFSEIDDDTIVKLRRLAFEQGQTLNPTLETTHMICWCEFNGEPIALSAMKRFTANSFVSAKCVEELTVKGSLQDTVAELGYVYVKPEHRGNGICSTMCSILLQDKQWHLVSATAEEQSQMQKCLLSKGFAKIGELYTGKKTGKQIRLHVLRQYATN